MSGNLARVVVTPLKDGKAFIGCSEERIEETGVHGIDLVRSPEKMNSAISRMTGLRLSKPKVPVEKF